MPDDSLTIPGIYFRSRREIFACNADPGKHIIWLKQDNELHAIVYLMNLRMLFFCKACANYLKMFCRTFKISKFERFKTWALGLEPWAPINLGFMWVGCFLATVCGEEPSSPFFYAPIQVRMLNWCVPFRTLLPLHQIVILLLPHREFLRSCLISVSAHMEKSMHYYPK